MKKFRLPRKRKKQYQKDNIVFKCNWLESKSIMEMMNYKSGQFRMINWLWFYQKEILILRNMIKVGLKSTEFDHLNKHHNIYKWL